MNFRTLTTAELANLVEASNAGAIEHLKNNARSLLTEAGDRAEARIRGAYDDGYQDGLDKGWDECRENLRADFENLITEELERTLEPGQDPDSLGKNKRRRWGLLTDILRAIE